MSNFTVCTYNMGSNEGDYSNLRRHLDPSFNQHPRLIATDEAEYNAAQNKTTDSLMGQADVYCLQEVIDENRPLIKSLKGANFQIINKPNVRGNFDCAIAVNTARFENITNLSTTINRQDVTIARATDITTKKEVLFVSAHIPGCMLENDTPVDADDASTGDNDCEQIMQHVAHIAGGCAVQIIGADMNANPEKWEPRFQKFTSRGFEVLRSNAPTNVNPNSRTYKERELDFIFVSPKAQATVTNAKPLSWNVDNASDHLPVFVTVNLVKNRVWFVVESKTAKAALGVLAVLALLACLGAASVGFASLKVGFNGIPGIGKALASNGALILSLTSVGSAVIAGLCLHTLYKSRTPKPNALLGSV